MQFFLLSYFCIFRHVVTSVLHNCVVVYLLVFLLFDIICIFSCLPYFLQSVYAVLDCFFLAYYSCLQLFDVCRLLAMPLSRFGQLAFTSNSLFLWCRLLFMYILLRSLCFTLLLGFYWVFLACFVLAFLLCKSACYTNFLLLVFVLCRSVAYFFASILLMHIYTVLHAPSFPPLSSERSSLTTWTIPVHFLVYCVVCMHSKYALFLLIYCSFSLVFASAIAHTPIRPHLHQPVPICVHSRHFLHILQKHDVRGNFPGHRTQILACKTIYAPCLPCFCVPRAQCTPTHPSAPTRTHLHLHIPVCTLTFHVHVCNLIKK